MAEGDIGSILDTLEFDPSYGFAPKILHVAGAVYAIAYTGPDNDGWIKAVTISADGLTLALAGGSLEFDANDGGFVDIIHVSGDIYAIVYEGVDQDGWIKTVEISADGSAIALAGGSLEFDDTTCDDPTIYHIAGDKYAIVYEAFGYDGTIRTVTISADGATITLAGGDLVFDAVKGTMGKLIHIAGIVYAVVYQGPDFDGWIKTVTISADGATIALAGGSLEFDETHGSFVDIIHIAGNVFAIAYQDTDGDGQLLTVTISADGATLALTGESLEFDTSYGRYSEILHVSGSVFVVVYTGVGDDGWMKTVTITDAGEISFRDGTGLEFDEVAATDPEIIFITGNIYAIVYGGDGAHGWLKTVDIETVAAAAVAKQLMMMGIG